jgi:hypothetical protein
MDASLFDWWFAARQNIPKPMHKGLASVTLLMPWMIKHRNDCVFERACPLVGTLVEHIKEEVALWVRARAVGLRDIVPTT